MHLFQDFIQNWKAKFTYLSSRNCHLILAVSGGIDSVVMADLISKSKFNFDIAHCNFQLRGEESVRDEAFVNVLAGKYESRFFLKQFETEKFAKENKLSIQEAARNLRYQWFNELILHKKKDNNTDSHKTIYVCTAHHADDNIETLLMHLFRGTGIKGLTGIPLIDKDRRIIRPLLFAKRDEILKYANENNLSWVEDSSNSLNKYTRNIIRNKLLPVIQEIFPDVKDNLLNNIYRLSEVSELYNQSIEQHKKRLIEQQGNEYHIPILKLQKLNPINTIIWEIIKYFNFNTSQTNEVKKLFDASNGSYVASQSHRIIKNRNWLIIALTQSAQSLHILIENSNEHISFENGELSFLLTEGSQLSLNPGVATINSAEITFPLLLRKYKKGDYFYPLGMNKKKKLSRFFIDQKLSKTQKENVWVVEMNKKIVWVINYRIDDRFKVTPSTKSVLKITFQEKKL